MVAISCHVLVVGFLCVSVALGFLIPDGIQKVNTKYGDIVGFIDQVTFDKQTRQVRKFLGIPYAEPPTGNLRFKKSVMKMSLPSPFHALEHGPICPQINWQNETMSEDCLSLNIYTPVPRGVSYDVLPVMIYIHGGGYTSGSSGIYGGDVISAFNDVIVVTINYRLGAVGFFSTLDDSAKGNYGLWDQHLSFRWVHENIGNFGGDNTRITIFGESAGGSSVVYQMMYKGNVGVVKRVISQSGTAPAWGAGTGDPTYIGSMNFAHHLGCNQTDHSQIVECLRQKSESDILRVNELVLRPLSSFQNEVNASWTPVFDGDFVPALGFGFVEELMNGAKSAKYDSFHSIDMMIGHTNFDGVAYFSDFLKMFQNEVTDERTKFDMIGERLYSYVIPRSIEAWLLEKPTNLTIELVEAEYVSWDERENITRRTEIAAEVYTDFTFNVPTIRTASAHADNQTSTYVYVFANAPPSPVVEVPPKIFNHHVANHLDDLPFVFGFHFYDYGTYGKLNFDNATQDDIKLSKAVMRMWTNFAKSGNPNDPANLKSLYDVTWPEYDTSRGSYLVINDAMSPSSTKQHLTPRAVEFWNNIVPKVQAFSKTHH